MKKLLFIIALIIVLMCSLLACNNSESTDNFQNQGTPHTHVFGEWQNNIEPTCANEGQAERVCSCGEKETKTLSKLTSYKLGSKVEDLSFITDNGTVFSLYDTLQEKKAVMFVFFMQSDYESVLYVQEVAKDYPEVEVIGISYEYIDESELYSLKYDYGIDTICTIDTDSLLERKFDIQGYPCFVLIDRNSKMAAIDIGESYETEQYYRAFDFYTKEDYVSATYDSFWKIPTYDISTEECIYHRTGETTVKTEATCTEYGTVCGHCVYCGTYFEYNYILPHEYTFGICTVCHCQNTPENNEYEGFSYTQSNFSITITKYNGIDINVTVPDMINGIPVTTISSGAFEGLTNIESIVIPDSVRRINANAFCNLPSLKSITLGKNVSYLEGYPLYKLHIIFRNQAVSNYTDFIKGCNLLESIYVDEDNKYFSSIDGTLYSKDGRALLLYTPNNPCTKFTVPDSVTKIYDLAFADHKNIEEVIVSSSTTIIGHWAFKNCSAKSIFIPSNVEYIGREAFYAYDNLTIYCESAQRGEGWEIMAIPPSDYVPTVWDCKNNDIADDGYIYVWKDNVRYAIKDGVATVVGAFSKNVTSLTISSTVEFKSVQYMVNSINEGTFQWYTQLNTIVIPKSITNIGASAIGHAPLTDVYYTGTMEEWESINIEPLSNSKLTNATIHYNYVPEE